MIEIDPQTRQFVTENFKKLQNPTRVIFFSGPTCQYCSAIKEILTTVQGMAPEGKVIFEEHNFEDEKELANKLGVDKYPATVIKAGAKKVYYYGIMSGYEFGSLIEDIIDLSTDDVHLEDETVKFLEKIKDDVRMQVFVTPTCPYCPRTVRLAHKFAMINPKIIADMVEAIEFPDLSNKYMVSGVPKTILTVNGKDIDSLVGAAPEPYFLDFLRKNIKVD